MLEFFQKDRLCHLSPTHCPAALPDLAVRSDHFPPQTEAPVQNQQPVSYAALHWGCLYFGLLLLSFLSPAHSSSRDRSLESGPSSIKKSFRSESTVFATQGTHSAHASSSPASLLATCTQMAALLCRPRSIQLCDWGCGCAAGLPEFQTWLHCFLDKLLHVSVPQFTCLSNGANTAYLMC